MNQFNKNKTNCRETGKFETGMDFYVPIGVILVELNPSNDSTKIETKYFMTKNQVIDLMEGEIIEWQKQNMQF
jgi:hypothetical protein